MRRNKQRVGSAERNREQLGRHAELAVQALAFLAEDAEQLGRFLALSGIDPATIREAARTPDFLAGVLDYLASDEPLMIAFARHVGTDPMEVIRAQAALGGVWERDIP